MADRRDSRARGRARGWWIVAAFVALALSLSAMIPSPYAVERPGPVVNAFGSIDTEEGEIPVISLSGVQTYPVTGELNILSVTISGSPDRPLSWLALARTWFDPTQSISPLADFYPEGVTAEERAAANEALMEQSEVQATAAALAHLGQKVDGTVRVASVAEGGPSAGLLQQGDAILTVGAKPIGGLGELQDALLAVGSGGEAQLGIERDGARLGVTVRPQAVGADPQPLLGVGVSTELDFPFEIDIRLDQIGGPSAGITFALALIDLLDAEPLFDGLTVSSTGTIDERGTIGAIGGLPQKIWGAARAGSELFLFPVSNCADLPESLPATMQVVPVATLEEAVAAIAAVRDGAEPATGGSCGIAE